MPRWRHASARQAAPGDASGSRCRKRLTQDSPDPPLPASLPVAEHVVRCWEAMLGGVGARHGVALYDEVLRDWPRGWTRDGGLYLVRLARACVDAGEPDRARVEGRKALAVARVTNSSVAIRELAELTISLRA
jgi:hypothetical protein